MKKILAFIIARIPVASIYVNIFRSSLLSTQDNLQLTHDLFLNKDLLQSLAVDLGCGLEPQNRFNATNVIGIDICKDGNKGIINTRLGFEKLPFENDSVDYLTAYDLLEHIPRYGHLPDQGNAPFIFFMNECYRVLKKGGIFLSSTPIYPHLAAFQDPTHHNIMTKDTLKLYFSNKKFDVASNYGIISNFEICHEEMLGPNLLAVLKK